MSDAPPPYVEDPALAGVDSVTQGFQHVSLESQHNAKMPSHGAFEYPSSRAEDAAVANATTRDEPATGALRLPAVVPQITKSFRGANFSPFQRAYVPDLEHLGIERDEFVAFIDGLNEAFIAHPIFTGLSVLGGVMTAFYGIHPVQWAGAGLQVASGAAGAGMSYGRTRVYVKAINASLFHPARLHVNVLTSKNMLAKIGYPEDKIHLPELESEQSGAPVTSDEVRLRRLEALQGYILPLDLNVPEQALPENLLRKMSAAQARRTDKKQLEKITEKREDGQKKYDHAVKEAEKKSREGDKDIAKVECKLEKERAKLHKRLSSSSSVKKREEAMEKFEKEEHKLQKDLNKEVEKRDKDVAKEMRKADKEWSKVDEKETKIANKIRWVVISNWEGEEEEAGVDEDGN